ncbi:hypothetical protein [Bradyrhizobium elkanii]|uniref:hypothetical protein n=1 Tax=Bradyrhizobium elkanii TaxID=29448 RepID=UPI002227D826|nr:hypothetical protein [Bradyrhizobium elkanii]MCW2228059.1 hypothetical protein [Bradyrhizobium elkanii]
MSTKSHLEKAISAADKITTSMAENALAGLDLSISAWPGYFRAIVWDAVAAIATRRAEAARKS